MPLSEVTQNFLNQIVQVLQADDRVVAAWVGGSIGRGTADEHSDIDLSVAVKDADYDGWFADRHQFYAPFGPIELQLPVQAIDTALYEGTLFREHGWLDMTVVKASRAVRGIDTLVVVQTFEVPIQPRPGLPDVAAQIATDCQFGLAMVTIARKYVRRDNIHKAVTQLDLVLGALINAWRLTYDHDRYGVGGVHWLHPRRDARLVAILPRLPSTIDADAMLGALDVAEAELRQLQDG